MPSAAESFLILGVTSDGKSFRPSDWAERLCGIMAQFNPEPGGSQGHLVYSPYVMPTVLGEQKCVRIDARLNDLEPLAYKFVLSFVNDNNLKTEPLR